jgi:hypothetical protein
MIRKEYFDRQPPTFTETQQRIANAIAQTRCDKRTLANITWYFLQKRGYVLSISELVRMALEVLEQIVEEESGGLEFINTEEADDFLRQQFKANLNPMRHLKPGGPVRPRLDYSFRKQMDAENALIESRGAEYVEPRTKKELMELRGKQQAEKYSDIPAVGTTEFEEFAQKQKEQYIASKYTEQRAYRTPDNMVVNYDAPTGEGAETPEQAEERRQQELQAEKAALGHIPANIISAHINEPTNPNMEEDENEQEEN